MGVYPLKNQTRLLSLAEKPNLDFCIPGSSSSNATGCPGEWWSPHPWECLSDEWTWHKGLWFIDGTWKVGLMVGVGDLEGPFHLDEFYTSMILQSHAHAPSLSSCNTDTSHSEWATQGTPRIMQISSVHPVFKEQLYSTSALGDEGSWDLWALFTSVSFWC